MMADLLMRLTRISDEDLVSDKNADRGDSRHPSSLGIEGGIDYAIPFLLWKSRRDLRRKFADEKAIT